MWPTVFDFSYVLLSGKNESKSGREAPRGTLAWPAALTKSQSWGQKYVKIRLWLQPKEVCVCVVGGQGVSKEAGWRVAPGSKGAYSLCYLWVQRLQN